MSICLWCVLWILGPVQLAGMQAPVRDSLPVLQVFRVDTTITAPVVFAHDTLFVLRAGVRGFTAEQRAERMSRSIEELAGNSQILPDSMTIAESELSTDIVAGDHLILSVFDIDASLKGVTRRELAERNLATIRTAVQRYRDDRSESTVLRGVVFSVLATIILVVLLRLLGRAGRWVETTLGSRLRGISIEKFEIVKAEWLRVALRSMVKLVRWTLVVVGVYGYLEFVLTRFVWTQPLAHQLLGLVLEPLKVIGLSVWNYLPNLFFLLVLFILTGYLLKFLRFIFGEIDRGRITIPGFYPDWGIPTYKIVRILVCAFAAIVAFPYVPGSSSPAFQGVSIFLGVLFSLGSTSAVANIVAGVILTYMRSFRTGDVVKIEETIGIVVSHGLLVTRVCTPKNLEVTFPNGSVLGTHVINYSVQARQGQLILPTSVTIGYDTPWRQVHALLEMAADRTEGVLKDPRPFVLQTALNDFYVTYELNVYTRIPERIPWIYSDLHEHIQDAFNEYGVQIMSPNYVMDRAKPTIVPRDQWYQPPASHPGKGG